MRRSSIDSGSNLLDSNLGSVHTIPGLKPNSF
jgi:hypothetical protein